jgi:hypothetical protein
VYRTRYIPFIGLEKVYGTRTAVCAFQSDATEATTASYL